MSPLLLLELTHSGAQDATIKIYDVISKTCLHALSGFEGGTGSLSFSPAGFRGTHGAIAGGAWNASFRVWDVEVRLLLVLERERLVGYADTVDWGGVERV
jgi:WD40 repeat protein